jgi:hypothetical protein
MRSRIVPPHGKEVRSLPGQRRGLFHVVLVAAPRVFRDHPYAPHCEMGDRVNDACSLDNSGILGDPRTRYSNS